MTVGDFGVRADGIPSVRKAIGDIAHCPYKWRWELLFFRRYRIGGLVNGKAIIYADEIEVIPNPVDAFIKLHHPPTEGGKPRGIYPDLALWAEIDQGDPRTVDKPVPIAIGKDYTIGKSERPELSVELVIGIEPIGDFIMAVKTTVGREYRTTSQCQHINKCTRRQSAGGIVCLHVIDLR